MGLDDALIFTRVVECHSFTSAATTLGMQKSTVSRRIAQLEERLGVAEVGVNLLCVARICGKGHLLRETHTSCEDTDRIPLPRAAT